MPTRNKSNHVFPKETVGFSKANRKGVSWFEMLGHHGHLNISLSHFELWN